MARFLNVYEKKGIAISKAYEDDYGHWIWEYELIAAIENDSGSVVLYPCCPEYIADGGTADECLSEAKDADFCFLDNLDWKIKKNITEWICNQGAVDGSSVLSAICEVVALLSKYGMWKEEYSKCIDIERIKKEYGEE